jgi:hypothetical protein
MSHLYSQELVRHIRRNIKHRKPIASHPSSEHSSWNRNTSQTSSSEPPRTYTLKTSSHSTSMSMSLNDIPKDIQFLILSFCSDFEIETLGMCSKYYLRLSRDDCVWKPRLISKQTNTEEPFRKPLIPVSLRYIYKQLLYERRVHTLKQRILFLDTSMRQNHRLIEATRERLTGNLTMDKFIHYEILLLQDENENLLEKLEETKQFHWEIFQFYWKKTIE